MANTPPEIAIVQKDGKILSVYSTQPMTRVFIVEHDKQRPTNADIEQRNEAIRRIGDKDMYGVY